MKVAYEKMAGLYVFCRIGRRFGERVSGMRLRFAFLLFADTAAVSIPLSAANAHSLKLGKGRRSFPSIQAAIDVAQTGYTIELQSTHTYTENIQLFPPVAAKELTIVGGRSTAIDGGGRDCVLQIDAGYTLRLSNVSLRNGKCQRGGGISNSGTLHLDKVIVSGNQGTQGGGGIFNADGASLELTHTVVQGNQSADPTAGMGGGILNLGTANIEESVGSGNTAAVRGGGFENAGVSLILRQATVSGNTTQGNGGGIDISAGSRGQPLTALIRTLVSKNTAASGGGIFNGASQIDPKVSLIQNNTPNN